MGDALSDRNGEVAPDLHGGEDLEIIWGTIYPYTLNLVAVWNFYDRILPLISELCPMALMALNSNHANNQIQCQVDSDLLDKSFVGAEDFAARMMSISLQAPSAEIVCIFVSLVCRQYV